MPSRITPTAPSEQNKEGYYKNPFTLDHERQRTAKCQICNTPIGRIPVAYLATQRLDGMLNNIKSHTNSLIAHTAYTWTFPPSTAQKTGRTYKASTTNPICLICTGKYIWTLDLLSSELTAINPTLLSKASTFNTRQTLSRALQAAFPNISIIHNYNSINNRNESSIFTSSLTLPSGLYLTIDRKAFLDKIGPIHQCTKCGKTQLKWNFYPIPSQHQTEEDVEEYPTPAYTQANNLLDNIIRTDPTTPSRYKLIALQQYILTLAKIYKATFSIHTTSKNTLEEAIEMTKNFQKNINKFTSDLDTITETHLQSFCNNCIALPKIRNYSFKPDVVFIQTKEEDAEDIHESFFGFELELAWNKDYLNESTEKALLKEIGELFSDKFQLFFKRDASIEPNGLEILSQPMSIKAYHENAPKLAKMFSILHNHFTPNKSCGMHIHSNRQIKHNKKYFIYNIFKLLLRSPAFIYHISGRESLSTMSRYATINTDSDNRDSNNSHGDWKHSLKLAKNAESCDRHSAINFLNRDTIEYRFWGPTMNIKKFLTRVETTAAIQQFCSDSRPSFISPRNFLLALQNDYRDLYPHAAKQHTRLLKRF